MTCAKNKDKSAGGCAFRGARMALQPIADAVHLSHGPVTCQGLPWDIRPTPSSGPTQHRAVALSDMNELSVIHGGAQRLRHSIAELAQCADSAAIFVYQTCTPAIIGDDIEQICTEMSQQLGRPVVAVDIPGFAGNRDHGSQAAAKLLLDRVIGTQEPDQLTGYEVNVVGEANVAGESMAITRLLEDAGFRVLASIPGDGRYHRVASAHRARATISLCSQSLGGLAAKLQTRYGIPHCHGSFHGMANIARTLRQTAALVMAQGGDTRLVHRVESFIAQQETQQRRHLAPLLPHLKGKRVLVLSGGFKSWGMIGALTELGLEVVGTSVQKTSPQERGLAQALLGANRLWEETTPEKLDQALATGTVDIVLSSSGHARRCQRAGIPWLDINHERRLTLSGYHGQRDLAHGMAQVLRRPPPPRLPASPPWRTVETR